MTTINANEEYIPRWQRVPTTEGHEEDVARGIVMEKVCLYFKNGILFDVVPDVYGYPAARVYNIDGKEYDILSIEDVNNIPIPHYTDEDSIFGSPTYNLEYQLRICATDERKKGNNELAYTLLKKGTEMMFHSKIAYLRHDFLRLYYWLLEDGKIDEAKSFFASISNKLPQPYSEKEYTKEVQHLNYALLKDAFAKEMPKSFSGYMRNYNAKNDKFIQYQKLAKEINIEL